MRRIWMSMLLVSLALTACGKSSSKHSTSTTQKRTTNSASSTSPAPLASLKLALTSVGQVQQPTSMAARAGDNKLYVTEQRGRVRSLENGVADARPVLDIQSEIASGGQEQGLLGITFSPDGSHLYVYYTGKDQNLTISEFAFNGQIADPTSERVLLKIKHPFTNHNGGQLTFGPDGFLYLGVGDGGSEGDPANNGQNLNTLLGKILRISPTLTGDQQYSIPSTNPFVGQANALPEIWSYGLRNPWKFSFDRTTNDLWIGDVGQDKYEEIDVSSLQASAGANYGWSAFEGNHPYKNQGTITNAVPPVYEYSHSGGGCSVIGGYVYRGAAIPSLNGAYLFSDYCLGKVMGLRENSGQVTEEADLGLNVKNPTSFGQDNSGNLYILSSAGTVYRIDAAASH